MNFYACIRKNFFKHLSQLRRILELFSSRSRYFCPRANIQNIENFIPAFFQKFINFPAVFFKPPFSKTSAYAVRNFTFSVINAFCSGLPVNFHLVIQILIYNRKLKTAYAASDYDKVVMLQAYQQAHNQKQRDKSTNQQQNPH